MITRDTIDWYLSRGMRLTPLSLHGGVDTKGKRPVLKNWTRAEVDRDSLYDYAERGHNLGCVSDGRHCILDVDIKSGGREGIERMLALHPTLCTERVVVVTGSGGWHLYGTIDPAVETTSRAECFPGVDLRRAGSQSVIPGSYHYGAGAEYAWAAGCSAEIPPFPSSILSEFLPSESRPRVVSSSPMLTNDELSALLDQIDVTGYAGNGTWFPLMCAAHHATGGLGIDAFVAWSVSDSRYAGHDSLIRYRWRTLDSGAPGSITYATLIDAVYKAGGQVPGAIRTKLDFVAHPEMLEYGVSTPEQAADIRETRGTVATLADRVGALTPTSRTAEVETIAVDVAELEPGERERLAALIHNQTKIKKSIIATMIARRAFARQTEREHADLPPRYGATVSDVLYDDIGALISLRVIDSEFARGQHLCIGPDDELWHFVGTHWAPIEFDRVEQLLMNAIHEFKASNPGAKCPVSTTLAQAARVFRTFVYRDGELFDDVDPRYTIVNCQNCEVWIANDSGLVSAVPHEPASRQRGVLPIEYDPSAAAPLFYETLRGIFAHDSDRTETIRHLCEIFGYAIQSRKNIPAWVMLYGPGGNGKSTILGILHSLLGSRVLSAELSDLDVSRNAHAFASMPGKLAVVDDDVNFGLRLPSTVLKKLSENKPLVANPKYKSTFEFENTAICIAASNGWPALTDVSQGVRRRAHIFQLLTNLESTGYDLDRGERLKAERPGILNELIRALQRMRARGGFDIPASVSAAHKEWLRQSNAIYRFLEWYRDEVKPHEPSTTINDMWDQYRIWATDEGVSKRFTRSSFAAALRSAGVARNARALDISDWIDYDVLIDAIDEFGFAAVAFSVLIEHVNRACKARASPAYPYGVIRDFVIQRQIPHEKRGWRIETVYVG